MTLRPYLITFDPTHTTRQLILDYLDTRPEIKNWYACFSGAIVIVSPYLVTTISDLLRIGFPNIQFLVTEIPLNQVNGILPRVAWNFINNPASSGRWP